MPFRTFAAAPRKHPTMNLLKRKKPNVLVLSDLHCGSDFALLPSGFKTNKGKPIHMNDYQLWAWEQWQKMEKWALSFDEELWIVLNGDMVEGVHHGGREIWSHDPVEHTRAALQCLKALRKKATKVFMVEGTECHTQSNEAHLGELLNAVENPTGGYSFPRLLLNINGVEHVWRHHISATTRPYLEGSALSIALGCERQESERAGHPVPRVLGAAHRHRHGEFCDGSGLVFVTGPWQGLTRHGHKVVSAAIPMSSAVMLQYAGKETGELPDLRRWTAILPPAKRPDV